MPPLAPIHPRYLRDQAFLSLREAIVSGRLAPGDPLVIDTLAEAFGLSSMPVREAVKRLVADGLVEELPRRAHRIAPLTRQTALDVLGVMEVLMVGAYELGVPQLDAAGVRAMRDALDRDAAGAAGAAVGDLTAALAAITAMHEVVYAATGNAELARVLSAISPRFDRVLSLWYTESIVDVATSYRHDLVSALERGERAEAIEIMRRAWRRFREVVAARADEGPAGSARRASSSWGAASAASRRSTTSRDSAGATSRSSRRTSSRAARPGTRPASARSSSRATTSCDS